MDRDVASSHDTIGTTFISMSQISDSQKKDTVPTFGPCFINIYGSPREFSHFPDKYDHLNQGVVSRVQGECGGARNGARNGNDEKYKESVGGKVR